MKLIIKSLLIVYFIISCNTNSVKGFSNENIYIILRGTESKRTLISKNFNIYDSLYTHIGIGFKNRNQRSLVIYHILPSSEKEGVLIESLSEFEDVEDLNCIGIYSINLSSSNYKKVENYVKMISDSNIIYDKNFDLDDQSAMYCSEFVIKALNQSDGFNIRPVKKEMPIIYKGISGKDSLIYYPVDILLNNKEIKLHSYKRI